MPISGEGYGHQRWLRPWRDPDAHGFYRRRAIPAELQDRLAGHPRRDEGMGRRGSAYHRSPVQPDRRERSEEHTSELQSLMRISYAVFCSKNTKYTQIQP